MLINHFDFPLCETNKDFNEVKKHAEFLNKKKLVSLTAHFVKTKRNPN